MNGVEAYNLRDINYVALRQSLKEAPHYNNHVRRAVNRAISMIHGLDRLHAMYDLSRTDVYIGRAVCRRVATRFKEHAARGFKYGSVLFTCDTAEAARMETIAIRLVHGLKARRSLCVGNCNVKRDGKGMSGCDSSSAVYMVWRTRDEPARGRKPTLPVVREVAREVSQDLGGLVRFEQLYRGLLVARRPSDAACLSWAAVLGGPVAGRHRAAANCWRSRVVDRRPAAAAGCMCARRLLAAVPDRDYTSRLTVGRCSPTHATSTRPSVITS